MKRQTSLMTWKKMMKLFPMLIVDGVLVENNKVLLVKRSTQPYIEHWVLPGGFVEKGEILKKAILREFWEETGFRTKAIRLVGAYDTPGRDPRGHTVSIVYLMKLTGGRIRTSDETSDVRFFPVNKLPDKIGFDHRKIIRDALKAYRIKKLK